MLSPICANIKVLPYFKYHSNIFIQLKHPLDTAASTLTFPIGAKHIGILETPEQSRFFVTGLFNIKMVMTWKVDLIPSKVFI